jgi:hypothetical protein
VPTKYAAKEPIIEAGSVAEVDQRIAQQPTPAYCKPRVTPLDQIRAFVERFVYGTPAQLTAITLWIAHTYVYKMFFATPRLGAFAEGEDSGKTTVLRMCLALCEKAVMTPNASAPSIFTIIEQEHPVLLFDEADGIWNKSGTGERGRSLRGILNEGAYEDGYVLRVVGGEAKRFPCCCPAAYAGIGRLSKTMMSRSVVINMVQAPPGAEIDEYEPALYKAEAALLRNVLKEWLGEFGPEMNLQPEMPAKLFNRAKQIWKVLIAIADLDGEKWGKWARDAALELACNIKAQASVSPGEEFIETVAGATLPDAKLTTGELIKLMAGERKARGKCSWADWLEEPTVAPRKIAALLRPYGIETHQFWRDGNNRRGYFAADFHLWAEQEGPDGVERLQAEEQWDDRYDKVEAE